jgi:hypothetical protein
MKIPPFGKWPTTQLTWLVQLLIGSMGAIAVLIRHLVTGEDAPTNIVGMIVGLLLVERLGFIGKRKTEFTPEQKARAKRIENGNDPFGNGQ